MSIDHQVDSGDNVDNDNPTDANGYSTLPPNKIAFCVVQSYEGEGVMAWVTPLAYFRDCGHCHDCFTPDVEGWGSAMEACLEWYREGTVEEAHADLLKKGFVYDVEFAEFSANESESSGEIPYLPNHDPWLVALSSYNGTFDVHFVRKSYFDEHGHENNEDRVPFWWSNWDDATDSTGTWNHWDMKRTPALRTDTKEMFADLAKKSCVFSEELTRHLEGFLKPGDETVYHRPV